MSRCIHDGYPLSFPDSIAFVLLFIIVLSSCGPAHIKSTERRTREYDTSELEAATVRQAAPGSLWTGTGSAQHLFTDARAFRPGDVVVVEIEEKADAHRSADTSLARDTETAAALNAFLDVVGRLEAAGLDPSLNATSRTNHKSTGSTGRTESLRATVPAMVRKVLPTGDLFIEGRRIVLVNHEEQHFYISGIVRAIDIDGNNSVKSSRIADAEIEFTGRGILTDNQRQGWFQRAIAWVWPF